MKKVLRNFMSIKILPRFAILFMDICMILFSIIFIFFLQYYWEAIKPGRINDMLWLYIITLVFFNTIFFLIFRTFSGVVRYTAYNDLMRIFYSLTLGYALSYLFLKVFSKINGTFDISEISFFSIYALNLLLMVFSRIFIKEFYQFISNPAHPPTNVFVYGTQKSGIGIAQLLNDSANYNYKVKGFISDHKQMIDKILLGVNVYGNDEKLFEVMNKLGVKTVIVSPQKIESIKDCSKFDKFIEKNIRLLTAPPLSDLNGVLTGKLTLRELEIEDLLPRDPIKINMDQIALLIEGKRILVTGAAGSIGSEIVRQVLRFNPSSLIMIDQAETPLHALGLELGALHSKVDLKFFVADVSNERRIEKIFAEFRPQYVFHAAAYKHVPMMETNVSESIQTNVLGTKIIANLAVKYQVDKFVMISTDKAVNPSNVMGCSKRICEIYIQSLAKYLEKQGKDATQFITTRFGNVLGSNGSVIPLFKEQIRKGGPVTVTHPDICRYFMTIPEACQLVLEAGSMGKGGEIYVFDMGSPVKIADLAEKMISLSGKKDIKITFTGLRPGEKLYEELLSNEEHTKPTHHEKIMIADVREYEYEVVKKEIDELIAISYEFDGMKTVQKMKTIVTEFCSSNSPYESIDQPLNEKSQRCTAVAESNEVSAYPDLALIKDNNSMTSPTSPN